MWIPSKWSEAQNIYQKIEILPRESTEWVPERIYKRKKCQNNKFEKSELSFLLVIIKYCDFFSKNIFFIFVVFDVKISLFEAKFFLKWRKKHQQTWLHIHVSEQKGTIH